MSNSKDSELRVTFINKYPEDPEWTAHIDILNNWQDTSRILRDIIQYARSGKFYPADMHVDLIEQYEAAQKEQIRVELLKQSRTKVRTLNVYNIDNVPNGHYVKAEDILTAINEVLAPNTPGEKI